MGRLERRERWEAAFSPVPLALSGAFLSLCLLFMPGLAGRAAFFAAASFAAWLSGRKVSPLAALVVIAGIVGANLLVPVGRLILAWGPLRIHQESLYQGLEKALTFEALVMVSKASLGPSLRLPGRFGSFFAEALRCYDRILERKATVRAATFFKDIDDALVSVYDGMDGTDAAPSGDPGNRGRPGDRFLPFAALAAGLAVALAVIAR